MTSPTAPVSSNAFVDRMEKHWVETPGNAWSEKLRAIWNQLAAAFGQAIGAHGTTAAFPRT